MRCWLVFLLIIYTLIGGSVINGSKRWIELGGINFQPSELAKLLMILYTSDYLVRRSEEIQLLERLFAANTDSHGADLIYHVAA